MNKTISNALQAFYRQRATIAAVGKFFQKEVSHWGPQPKALVTNIGIITKMLDNIKEIILPRGAVFDHR